MHPSQLPFIAATLLALVACGGTKNPPAEPEPPSSVVEVPRTGRVVFTRWSREGDSLVGSMTLLHADGDFEVWATQYAPDGAVVKEATRLERPQISEGETVPVRVQVAPGAERVSFEIKWPWTCENVAQQYKVQARALEADDTLLGSPEEAADACRSWDPEVLACLEAADSKEQLEGCVPAGEEGAAEAGKEAAAKANDEKSDEPADSEPTR